MKQEAVWKISSLPTVDSPISPILIDKGLCTEKVLILSEPWEENIWFISGINDDICTLPKFVKKKKFVT